MSLLAFFFSGSRNSPSVGKNAYPSEKEVDSPWYRKNLSSNSEIVADGVFQLIGRLQGTEINNHSFIHLSNIYQVPIPVIKTQILPERFSHHQERKKKRDANKDNVLLWGHLHGGPSVGPDSQSGSLQVPRGPSLQCCAISWTMSQQRVHWEEGDGVDGGTFTDPMPHASCFSHSYGEPWSPKIVKVSHG